MGKTSANLSKQRLSAGPAQKYGAALLLYIALSVYLFYPYWRQLSGYYILHPVNPVIAAWGAYFLSRRWLNNWTPSLLAGAIYGFSPYALSFASFQQPVAGLSFVIVPWLFLPSVYWHKNKPADGLRFFLRSLFVLLPFAGICLLFWGASQKWAGPHFLMPQEHLTPKHFVDLIFPLYRSGPYLTFGIYHVPLLLSIMGLFVLVSIQRIAVVVPIAAAMVLCFWEPIFQVPPIAWAAIPILFLAILAGLGFQSILLAGKGDAKWILIGAVAASLLAAFFGGLAFKRLILRNLLEWTALMYMIAAAALWVSFVFAWTGHRWPWTRWIILTAATAADLILSARYMVDKLF